jgi:hypothetical protein
MISIAKRYGDASRGDKQKARRRLICPAIAIDFMINRV